jgi:putative transposase
MDGDRIILQGLGAVGWIEVSCTGPIYLNGERGELKIRYNANRGKWYASIAFSKVSEKMVRGEWRQVPRQPKGNLTAGIDIGINNLMAIYVENGLTRLINGRPLKSISYYWRKKIAEYQSTPNKYGLETSKRLRRMYAKWRRQIRHYIDARVREPWSGSMTSVSQRSRSAIQKALRRRTATSITSMSGHTDTC